MKLIKKILPLATIASVSAIITPVITSCATNTILKFDATQELKIQDWKLYDQTTQKQLAATADYWDAIYADPIIFERDMIYGKHKMAQLLPEIMAYFYADYFDAEKIDQIKVNKYDVTLENLKVQKTDIITSVSYKASINVIVEGPKAGGSDSNSIIARYQTKAKFNVENCPIFSYNTFELNDTKFTSVGTMPSEIYNLYKVGYMPSKFQYDCQYDGKVGAYNVETKTFTGDTNKMKFDVSMCESNISDAMIIWETILDDGDWWVLQYTLTSWPSYYFSNTLIE